MQGNVTARREKSNLGTDSADMAEIAMKSFVVRFLGCGGGPMKQ